MKTYSEFTQLDEGKQAKLRAGRALERGFNKKASAESSERKAKPAVTPPKFSPAPRHKRPEALPKDSPRHTRTGMRNNQAPKPQIGRPTPKINSKPDGPGVDSRAQRNRVLKDTGAGKTMKKFGKDVLKVAKRVGKPTKGPQQSASGSISAGPTAPSKYTA